MPMEIIGSKQSLKLKSTFFASAFLPRVIIKMALQIFVDVLSIIYGAPKLEEIRVKWF
jgi:hypothetical protein